MKKQGIRHQALGASFKKRRYFANASSLKPNACSGFTVLFAALIAALLLAVGLAIFDIIFKQVTFARMVRDSNYAIYAADTGSECALYWDFKCTEAGCADGSAFATSSASIGKVPAAGLMCNGQDILTVNDDILTGSGYSTEVEHDARSATTTFALYLSQDGTVPYCAIVQVAKWADSDGIPFTAIISRGYNTCDLSNQNRIERAYLVSY